MRRTARYAIMLLLSAISTGAAQGKLVLGPYAQPDGAITVFPDGATVEPYFAMRALLAAQALGLGVQPEAERYIAWQAARLKRSPSFARYCRVPGADWSACGASDADDAALATWLELLTVVPAAPALKSARRQLVATADSALKALFDVRTGVYQISSALRVSLFMDNVEIASAFDAMAAAKRSVGDERSADALSARSRALRVAIDSTFWDVAAHAYRITTQQRPQAAPAFYPERVADGYLAFFGYDSKSAAARETFTQWMRQHRSEWLGARDREFPWGLIAMAAEHYGDRRSVECWLGQAISLRHGPRWNVLEEAILQGLLPRVGQGGAVPACVGGTA